MFEVSYEGGNGFMFFDKNPLAKFLLESEELAKVLQQAADEKLAQVADSIGQNNSSVLGQSESEIENGKKYYTKNLRAKVVKHNGYRKQIAVVDSVGHNAASYEAEHGNLQAALLKGNK